MIKHLDWFHVQYRLMVTDLKKMDFFDIFSKNYSSTKFHANLPGANRVVPSGQTDRHDEADSRFSQF